MAMLKGYRLFNGKRYEFFMFADTKREARAYALKHQKRMEEGWGYKPLYRITKGKDPWKKGASRYSIWVRSTRSKG